MHNNTGIDTSPYAPPKSAVADAQVAAPTETPWQVKRAVKCLWFVFGFGMLIALWSIVGPKGMQTVGPRMGPGPFFMGMMYVIIFLISYWLYSAIAKGRNWARILYLVLTVFGALYIPFMIYAIMIGTQPMLEGIGGLINNAIGFYVFYLLVTRPAREWFAAMKEAG